MARQDGQAVLRELTAIIIQLQRTDGATADSGLTAMANLDVYVPYMYGLHGLWWEVACRAATAQLATAQCTGLM